MKLKLLLFASLALSLILLSIPSQEIHAGSRFSALPDFFGLGGESGGNSSSWPAGAESDCSSVTVTVEYPNVENPVNIPVQIYDYVEWFLTAVYDKDGNTIPSQTGLIGQFPVGSAGNFTQTASFNITTPLSANESYYLSLSYQITGGALDGGSGTFDLGAIGDHPYWQFRAGDTGSGNEFFCNQTIANDPPTVYVLGDTTELEGSGAVTHNVTLFLDRAINEPVRLDLESRTAANLPAYTFSRPSFNGYGTRGISYGTGVCVDTGDPTCIVPSYSTVTIPAGQTSITVPITVYGDNTYEDTIPIMHTHNVQIIRAGNAQIGTPSQTDISQRNDDPCQSGPGPGCWMTFNYPGGSQLIEADEVTFLVDNITVNEDAGNAVLTVNLTAPNPGGDLTITYSTTSENRNAIAGEDYTAMTNQTIVFANGEQTKQITIPLLFDPAQEDFESFGVTIGKTGTEQADTVTVGVLINDVYVGPTQYAPSGTVNSDFGNPSFSWNEFGLSDYEIYVEDVPASAVAITETINSSNCNAGTCSIDLTTISETYRLNAGNYQWSIRSLPSGQWVGPMGFTLTANPPALVTISPVSVDTLRPTFIWTLNGDATNATQFQISLTGDNATTPLDNTTWYSRTSMCGSPTGTSCSYTMQSDLVNDVTYSLSIKSAGPGGESAYAGPEVFTIDLPDSGSPR